jgi:hypothetical protein
LQWGRWGIDGLGAAVQPGSGALLTFNEPNHLLQSGMTPAEAAVSGAFNSSRHLPHGFCNLQITHTAEQHVAFPSRSLALQALWPQVEAVADKLGLRLGAPAAAPCGAKCVTPSPFDWWDEFFAR